MGFSHEDQTAMCYPCPLKKACHAHLETKLQSDLAYLHFHLNAIGAIASEQQLSSFGSIARYFPQSGGLLVAKLIERGIITDDTLLAGVELMASLGLARFKRPGLVPGYEFPFEVDVIEEDLENLYPYELFPELYDLANERQNEPQFRDFNPAAGAVVRAWLSGSSWGDLKQLVTHAKFAEGDLMNLILRTGSYVQSLVQCRIEPLSSLAASLRSELVRDPLGFGLG
jgi:hypothetical protein